MKARKLAASPDPLLEEVIQRALQRGAQQAEAFRSQLEETPVIFEANRLKEVTTRQIAGLALRLVADGRLGAASSSHFGQLEELVEMALEAALFGPPSYLRFPPEQTYPNVPTYDEQVPATPIDEMVVVGEGLIREALRLQPELVCDAYVHRAVQKIEGANSAGGRFSFQRSIFSVGLHGVWVRGNDMLFVGDSLSSCQRISDPASILEEVTRQLTWASKTATITTGTYPVVFTPLGVASALIGPLMVAFSGRAVYLGQSPLASRLGEKVYDSHIYLWDDPTIPYRPRSRICDDEGVPSRRVSLVEGGLICSFLYDLQTAGMAKAEPTGHGHRGAGGYVDISPSCLVMAEGEASLEELIADIYEGLVIDQLIGAGQGNVMGGDFSGNVLLGYKIEKGKVVGRIKDVVVAGNVHQLLGHHLLAVGRPARWVGSSLRVPPIALTSLSVAAR